MRIVQPDSPARRIERACRRSTVLRGRHVVLRTYWIRCELRRGDACDGGASVTRTPLCGRASWTGCSLHVHSRLLARLPQHPTCQRSPESTDAHTLFSFDGRRECGAHTLDRQGSCAQILLRPRCPLLGLTHSRKVLLDSRI